MIDNKRNLDWLNDKLKKQVKELFEPRYDRVLSEDEVFEIASNLADFIEVVAKASNIDDKLKREGTA